MRVETSAIVAMVLEEADAEALLERVDAAEKPVTTVVNALKQSYLSVENSGSRVVRKAHSAIPGISRH